MAVIQNHKTGMGEVRTLLYKDLTGARKQKTRGALPRRAKPLNGERNFKLKEDQCQYELKKFCGYLSDGFRTKNEKRNTFLTKKPHIIGKDSAWASENESWMIFGHRMLSSGKMEIMKLERIMGSCSPLTYLKNHS